MCEDCAKVEMPCNCLPEPPDKPLPFIFQLSSGSSITYNITTAFGANSAGNVYLMNIAPLNCNYSVAPLITLPVSDSIVSFDGSAAGVDIATDIITAPSGFLYLNTGDPVTYNNGGGTTITGLTNNTVYYLIKVSGTTCRLATTAANAFANVWINLTVVGTMTQTLTGIRATATANINAQGDYIGATLTNPGSGYFPWPLGSLTPTVSAAPTNLINVITDYNLFSNQPISRLAYPPPPNQGAGVTLGSAKCIFQIAGYVEASAATNWTGQWYKNGVAIGNPMKKDTSSDLGYTKLVHYTTPISFSFTDKVTYKITSTGTSLVNFTGDSVYFIQYV